MKEAFKEQYILDADDIWRIERAQMAVDLHKLPEEIDNAPAQDIWDVQSLMAVRIENMKKPNK